MLSKTQLKIADFCNNSIAALKKLIPNSFCKEKYLPHYQKYNFVEARIKAKKHIVYKISINQNG